MAREIERKFLITGNAWRDLVHKKVHFAQGYLNDIHQAGSKSSVRIRIEGDQANINIKSLEIGLSRDEYEYPIDLDDAKKMLDTLSVGPVIEKFRHYVTLASHTWEIDEFLGDNKGLIVAEVELGSEDELLVLPDWVTHEVTEIPRYYNISLSQTPYCQWSPDEKEI
ncbi:CYTH domain protein [Hydrogenovibrio sp. SC-1]|uniref:CYTH domain-containing protein n=1 Tax=Hydrogenovibrio sp. SC-1 TaxID=2065820 RepID=UPI000C7DA196|nr:CYTH domain-containing protein [Hydrogenovibrio sp. SC-1]PLA73809.1 CYTH domain protein [Hydrogenovibrio sp. SC-1]